MTMTIVINLSMFFNDGNDTLISMDMMLDKKSPSMVTIKWHYSWNDDTFIVK